MEEPLNSQQTPVDWTAAAAPWQHAVNVERGRRRALLRRLAALLGTGTVAFTLTTWLLLRHEGKGHVTAPAITSTPKKAEGAAPRTAPKRRTHQEGDDAPLEAARAQLDALNRDDIRGAYDLFTPQYRSAVSFAAFRRLIASHRRMFHTDEEDVVVHSQTADRASLEIHVQSDDDEDYVAHFTMVLQNGHWLVDDLRWGYEDDDNGASSA